jgi:hypothetical protein
MLESICSLFAHPERVIDLIVRISRWQTELADLKNAERALGIFNTPNRARPKQWPRCRIRALRPTV